VSVNPRQTGAGSALFPFGNYMGLAYPHRRASVLSAVSGSDAAQPRTHVDPAVWHTGIHGRKASHRGFNGRGRMFRIGLYAFISGTIFASPL
jgi:hypothetical protein